MKTCFSVGPLLVLVLFAEPFQTYLLVTIANVVDTLNHIFFLLGECHALFNVWTATNVLQFSSGTVSLNFVWLLQNSLSLTINLIVSFSFIHYRYFVWTATPLFLFSEWNCPTLLCVNVTKMPCVSSPLSLCECHTCASSFSLCECHTNILVSPLLLCGHSTLFPFTSWLIHSRSNLVWTATPHFLNEKFTRATNFHISHVKIYLQFLVFFFRLQRII